MVPLVVVNRNGSWLLLHVQKVCRISRNVSAGINFISRLTRGLDTRTVLRIPADGTSVPISGIGTVTTIVAKKNTVRLADCRDESRLVWVLLT